MEFRSDALCPHGDRGIALALVMLTLLITTVLAAGIILSSQTETIASYNYRIVTQGDYLAKAGIQTTVNWLKGSRYQAASQAQAGTYYNVISTGDPYNLWSSSTSPVNCISSTNCSSVNSPVQLMGISGTGSTNYPISAVASNFASDLVNVRITGDNNNSGLVSINAVLLQYQTVNIVSASGTPTALPLETWRITSRATWTGSASSSGGVSTVVEEAIVQPIYVPSWGNSLYGYCSVSMQGSAGVCTDSFNSALGSYGGGNPTVASGLCDSNSPNVISAGAGIGANGSVTVGSNVVISGNVAIGSGPSAACPTPYGFFGSTSSVLGEVVQGPHVDPPTPPAFRAGFPSGAPNLNLGANDTTQVPSGLAWPPMPPFPNRSYTPPFSVHSPCMDSTCDGSFAHPYEVNGVSMTGGGNGNHAPELDLIGGPDAFHPVYYDIDSFNQNQGNVVVSGYVALNIRSSFNVNGQGITSGNTCNPQPCSSVPPAAVTVNSGCAGSCIGLGGNGAAAMTISAPNADISLGGGGGSGYFVGAIKARNISVQGGYPVHYDVQLDRANGTVGQYITTGYSRKRL